MESTETKKTDTQPVVVVPKPPAPVMSHLVHEGWKFATTRFDLIGWYVVTMTAMTIVSSEPVLAASGIVVFFAVIATLILSIYLAINTWTVIHAVSQENISATTFKDSFGWAAGNFFPLLWTSILSGLTIIFGLVLFVIPGIALSIYLYFSIYAHVHGAKPGVRSLKQSFALVKGRWWQTLWHLTILSFFIFVLFIIAGVVYGMAYVVISDIPLALFVLDIFLLGVYGAILGVISIYSLGQYYKWLQATTTKS